jgi:drug/metabolite transporter (DMT)-like permease
MILGMALCFIPIIFQKRSNDESILSTEEKPKAPISALVIPLIMDLVATALKLISLNYVAASVFSIVNCLIVVSTAFFSRIILKTVFNRHQILGCVLTIIGVMVAGVG